MNTIGKDSTVKEILDNARQKGNAAQCRVFIDDGKFAGAVFVVINADMLKEMHRVLSCVSDNTTVHAVNHQQSAH